MAKRPTRKRKSTASKPLPGWIWLLTGLFIGLSATFFPRLNQDQHTEAFSTTDKPDTKTTESSTNRKFDFYTLLPELEVVVDGNNRAASSSTNLQDETGTFVLQVGSFKNNKEADTLKARLALMGVETNIEIVTVNAVKWHRVRVGPSQDKAQLHSIQARLREQKMDSVLLKVRS